MKTTNIDELKKALQCDRKNVGPAHFYYNERGN